MTSKARQATVTTILALKQSGVMKDIRTLIAKLVYGSRAEVCWYVQRK